MSKLILLKGKDRNGNETVVRTDPSGRLQAGYFVRSNIHTGYATLNSNAETTLIDGMAAHYHDLCLVQCTNTSSNAVRVTLQNGTGGSATFDISGSALLSYTENFNPPIPSSEKGQAWTVKFANPDISNTTLYLFGMALEQD